MIATASADHSTQARRHRERLLPINAPNARDCALEATRTRGLPSGGTTMISIVQLRKSFPISIALFFVGAMLALFLSFGTSAQNQTLFADDFEDGNADGWTKSGGGWSVASDGSQVYRIFGSIYSTRARAV